ncbi:6-phospho-beta-glucosidase [Enterococcus sp. PF1-24]|uniref:family 1 glycosylhydrolase n=1 Tax=unclassified Enterococcus TaxID=2608891 RepID=UPI002475F16A|nr:MULTISPECIES: family 1 glycosylhydrolase [unclassified Enterococcus]MDH6365395.1 6-phospho-beta-glucosidase [Enterococcus sp. PFB1-1]MDH6402496.1 6-phospho-beta-glucosidase [Enterococcus sp. PF1-24]
MTLSKNFLWGGAISANQSEGAYLADGKGLSNFDKLPLNDQRLKTVYTDQENILDDPTAFFPSHQAINFYQTYHEDIKLLAEMGIKCFRFSIAWTRLFPTGMEEVANPNGVAFYDDLIDTLLSYQIEPLVTISHFDIPMYLVENFGGWAGRETVDAHFTFAKFVVNRYHEKVKYWIPFNEMNMLLHIPFVGGGLTFTSTENKLQKQYQAAHHQLVANARIIEFGKNLNSDLQFGSMLAAGKSYAYTAKPEDNLALMLKERNLFFFGDVQARGKYPNYVEGLFEKENIHLEMQPDDKKLLAENTVDFISFSYYSSDCVAEDDTNLEKVRTNGFTTIKNPNLVSRNNSWQIDEIGLRIMMNNLYDRYNLPLFIVENGLGTPDELSEDGCVHDDYRIDYLDRHLRQMITAVEEDHIELLGYTSWGCIDLTSVTEGRMSKRYGYIYVDIDDYGQGSHKRYPKDSYYWYQKVIQSNGENLK